MANYDCDVAIVGSGPAGLTLANLLGGMGVKVMLIERNESTVQEPRAVSIDDESMRTMQAAGVADQIEAILSRGYGSRYLDVHGRMFANVDPVSKEYGFDKRNGFQQPEFEDVLRQALKRFANVETHFRTEMQRFAQDAEGVTLTLAGPDGVVRDVRAKYLAGCDGGRSSIRKAIGSELQGSTFSERWLILDLHETWNRFRHTEVFARPLYSGITLPGPNGLRRYEFKIEDADTDEIATSDAFARKLLAMSGPDEKARIKRQRVYTFHARVVNKWREGRVFLAGDAAHLTPPFAGQGMNSGMRDVHNLAWKLAEASKGQVSEDLLESYAVERPPHAWEMINLALNMGVVMSPTSSLQGWLVQTAFRIAGLIPPVRDYFMQMRYKPKPRFKTGLFWPDGRSGKATIVGRLLPQPLVEAPDRSRTLLDNVLPDQPVVLVFAATPELAIEANVRHKLEAAGAKVVGLAPEWMNVIESDMPAYRDVSRFFSTRPLIDYKDHALLLRRDRYVAAAVPLARAGELEARIKAIRAN